MPEALMTRPVDALDDPYTGAHLTEQAGFLDQYEARFTPAFAYEVGHDAVASTVVVQEAGVERRGRPQEAQAEAMAAETWRSYSPFKAENAVMYGSEEARLAAVETVRGIANQAQMTNKYLNGQHKVLGRRLAAGEITKDQHDEAVGEIAAVMAFTKPAHLRKVGEAQRASIARRQKAGQLSPDVEFVDLSSRATENGVELAGIDSVVAGMVGARTQAELAQTGLAWKQFAYKENAEAFAKATARHKADQEALKAHVRAVREQEARRQMDLIDEEASQLFKAEAKKKEDVLASK